MTIPNKVGTLALQQLIQFMQPTGVLDTVQIKETAKFGAVSWVKKYAGIYTPNNDVLALLPADLGPSETANLIFFSTEGGTHANFMEWNRNDDYGGNHPVKNFFLKMSPDGGGIERPKQFFIHGGTGHTHPMAQGVPVSYCLIIAQVDLL